MTSDSAALLADLPLPSDEKEAASLTAAAREAGS